MSHRSLEDQEFEHAFKTGKLEPSLFNHEAHLRLAWIYLRKYGMDNAIVMICKQIESFDNLHGDGEKFHVTLTVAALKVVHHFMLKSNAADFSSFMSEFPVLNSDFASLLYQHYGQGRLFSKEAKVEYVAPDVLPFD